MRDTKVKLSTVRVVGIASNLIICAAVLIGLPACAVVDTSAPPAPPSSIPTNNPGNTAGEPPPDDSDGDPVPPGSPPTAAPTPLPTNTPGNETVNPDDPAYEDAVAAFQQRCEQGIEDWRHGQVDYPEDLSVSVGGAVNYNAAIDIRSEPLPPDEVIDADDGAAASEAVLVKCTVAARLTTVGDALGVAEEPDETVSGWVMQEFTPAGVVEWSWTVTAHKPVDDQLTLDLRPAIVVGDEAGDLEYASQNVASFTTDVSVDASLLHRTAYWFEVNWPLIVAIATAVGVGTLAVLSWLRKLRGQDKPGPQPTAADPDKE